MDELLVGIHDCAGHALSQRAERKAKLELARPGLCWLGRPGHSRCHPRVPPSQSNSPARSPRNQRLLDVFHRRSRRQPNLPPSAQRWDCWLSVKLISWNVNGLRAVLRKNFLEFLAEEKPDILCLQETRAGPDDVEQLWPVTYTTYWNVAQKKGYSGTAIFTKTRPLHVQLGMGVASHDGEGRILNAEYRDFFLVNVYV